LSESHMTHLCLPRSTDRGIRLNILGEARLIAFAKVPTQSDLLGKCLCISCQRPLARICSKTYPSAHGDDRDKCNGDQFSYRVPSHKYGYASFQS